MAAASFEGAGKTRWQSLFPLKVSGRTQWTIPGEVLTGKLFHALCLPLVVVAEQIQVVTR